MSEKRRAEVEFFSGLIQNPAFAVTITFRYMRGNSVASRVFHAQKSIACFLDRFNRQCNKRAYRRFKRVVGTVAVLEGIDDGKKIHCHLALEAPKRMSRQEVEMAIKLAVNRVRSIGQIKVVELRDDGWYWYITKDKRREVLWELCCSRTPSKDEDFNATNAILAG
jgi:hypothetical protein